MVSCRIWQEKALTEQRGTGSDNRRYKEKSTGKEPIRTPSCFPAATARHTGQPSVTAQQEAEVHEAVQDTPPPGGWGCRRTGQAKQGCLRLSQCPPSFDEISFDLTVLLIRTQGQASLKKGSSILLCCLGILLYRVCLPSFLLCVLKPGVPCPFKRTFPGGGLEWARAVFSGSLLLSSPTVGLRSLENMASL